MTSPPPKRVAIIGAGPAGLVALKECLAAKLQPTVFERARSLGGQWVYDPSPTADSHSSIYAGVVLNSSRMTAGFSDFPLNPERYPVYYRHELHLRYLKEYTARFGLNEWVRYETSVAGCAPMKEGKWAVRVKSGEEEEVLEFDAVICATGIAKTPFVPECAEREKFQGEVLHSHYYRTPTPYEGKRVVIVGLGASAIDIASEVAPLAKDVTIVSRRGAWVLPRFVLGKPVEAWDSRFAQCQLPLSIQEYFFEKVLNHAVGKAPPEMRPDHGIINQNAALRTDFIEKVQTGLLTIKRSTIASLTPTGVTLADGTNLDADTVIFATGYRIVDEPYLSPGVLAARDAPSPHIDLYNLIVPPRLRNLFIMGQTEQQGPANPVCEAQARYITGILTSLITLPSPDEMMKDIRAFRAWQQKRFVNSERHVLTVEFVGYIDKLMAPLGATPTFWKLLRRMFSGNPVKALSVLNAVFMGIPCPAQWRLVGEGSCRKVAESTLLRTDTDAKCLSEVEKKFMQIV